MTPLALSVEAPKGVVWLFAVADGMGGQEFGEVASRVAVNALSEHLAGNLREISEASVERRIQLLREAFVAANERVLGAQQGSGEGPMGTTLVASLLCGTELYIGNAGDSRCYLLKDGEIVRATKDDSVVQQMVDANLITDVQARSHPKRSLITQALGVFTAEGFQPVVIHRSNSGDHDYLLLCSDGLHAFVPDDKIAKTVYDAVDIASAAAALADQAVKGGGSDDVSIVLARFSHVEPRGNSIDSDEKS